jgi:hypothetical protein
MDLHGSQTEKNLLIAFAGESQARNRYTFYAGEARKAGFEYVAAVFLETAENEKEHAKLFYKHLGEGVAEIFAGYPFHLGETLSNLEAAAGWGKLRMDHPVPELCGGGREGGLPGDRRLLPGNRQGGEIPRSPLPGLNGAFKKGHLVPPGGTHPVALPQLRLHCNRQARPGGLPLLQAPPGLLRTLAGELSVRTGGRRGAGGRILPSP